MQYILSVQHSTIPRLKFIFSFHINLKQVENLKFHHFYFKINKQLLWLDHMGDLKRRMRKWNEKEAERPGDKAKKLD